LSWVLPVPEEFGPQLLGSFERLEVGLFNARELGPVVVGSHGHFAAPEIQVKSLHDHFLSRRA
jgi:hypothetical protein